MTQKSIKQLIPFTNGFYEVLKNCHKSDDKEVEEDNPLDENIEEKTKVLNIKGPIVGLC